jgi:23S rRNA (uracil1939-C5)-methyltransferase
MENRRCTSPLHQEERGKSNATHRSSLAALACRSMNEAENPGLVVRLAARGDGVTADGRFVAGAVPGDLVAPDGSIASGPDHVVPACRHFGDCGGCQLQHASEALLADFARARCLDPLARVGIVPAEVRPAHLSPAYSRRRTTMRAVRQGREVRLGFNAEGAHRLIDLGECPVLAPPLFALVEPLRALLGRLLPDRGVTGITATIVDGGVDLLLSNIVAERLETIEALTRFAEDQGLVRLSVEGPLGVETVVAAAAPAISFGGVPVVLPPGAFLQATADGEAALVAAVLEAAAGAAQVADLFCGVGTFALPLSRSAKVMAVDAAGPAVEALSRAARMARRPVETQHRDLFRRPLDPAELARFDAVVFDPPRSGAIAQSAALAQSRVPVVVAVSCNPATFARDAERLVAGDYVLETLWPVSQFRWSTHVELVARFARPS